MSVPPLACPFCGGTNLEGIANQQLAAKPVTPYYCPRCRRTVESGPFQLPQTQKMRSADPELKRNDS